MSARRTGVQKQPTGRNYADSYRRKILHINTTDWKKLPRLTTFDPTHFDRWTIFYWYSLQETDKFVDFSWHRIYGLWRNKETNKKFSFWVRIKWRQKTLLGSAFQRLRFPYLLPLPAISSPLVSRALDPLYPSTNVEQIIWGDQKIWSGELAAQTLTRDNDLRCYYGLKLHTNVCRWYIYCKILRQKLTA